MSPPAFVVLRPVRWRVIVRVACRPREIEGLPTAISMKCGRNRPALGVSGDSRRSGYSDLGSYRPPRLLIVSADEFLHRLPFEALARFSAPCSVEDKRSGHPNIPQEVCCGSGERTHLNRASRTLRAVWRWNYEQLADSRPTTPS